MLINGDFATSPWVTPERLAREGALVVWREGDPAPALAAQAGATRWHVMLPYRAFPKAQPLIVNYAILPPAE